MALTTAEIAQVYDVIELPQSGSTIIAPTPGNPYDHGVDYFDATALVTAIDAKLAALTASQVTRCQTLLARWETITSTSPVVVRQDGGVLADHAAERANIKAALERIIGLKIPHFQTENPFSIQR